MSTSEKWVSERLSTIRRSVAALWVKTMRAPDLAAGGGSPCRSSSSTSCSSSLLGGSYLDRSQVIMPTAVS